MVGLAKYHDDGENGTYAEADEKVVDDVDDFVLHVTPPLWSMMPSITFILTI